MYNKSVITIKTDMFAKIRQYATLDKALPLFAVVIALSWVWSTVGVMQHNFQFQRQVDELRQQVALLKLQDQSAQYRIQYYNSDEYAELAARQDLGLARPGEKEVIVPPSPDEQTDTNSTVNGVVPSAAPAQSNFQQWMFFLFHQRSQR
jgi:cell division protein FtsB